VREAGRQDQWLLTASNPEERWIVLEMVRNILNRFASEAEIIVFGSRVHGTAKPWSVLDLAIKAESALDWKLLEEIKEAFQESELPFRVDILDWNEITGAFRRAVERCHNLRRAHTRALPKPKRLTGTASG